MVRNWVQGRRRVAEVVPPARLDLPAADPAPSKPANANSETTSPPLRSQAYGRIIRSIGAPLLAAVGDVAARLRQEGSAISSEAEAAAFAQLVQAVVSAARTASAMLDVRAGAQTSWSRQPIKWLLLDAVSELVSGHYRATGLLQPSPLAGQLVAALVQLALDGARREDLMPGLGAATEARLALDTLKAAAPVVHAAVRHSGGRPQVVLVAEIIRELQFKAAACTKRLLVETPTLAEWHSVYGSFLEAAGLLYAEAHYSEAEKMAEASLPPEQIVQAALQVFDSKLDQLTVFSSYLVLPPDLVAETRELG